jgi:hypothetical protein
MHKADEAGRANFIEDDRANTRIGNQRIIIASKDVYAPPQIVKDVV